LKPLIAGLCLLLLWPLAALAHAHLLQALPAEGSVISTPPTQFSLKFSEAATLTALSLHRQGDPQPHKIAPLPTTASAQIDIPAPPLEPGVYELSYRLISADGHVMGGSVHFTIAAK
jgi:methionine-rich copper-binding protein CopC